MTEPPNRQSQHYDAIHDAYARHYYDPTALAYRERFILDPLLSGLSLDGCRVADLACGDGYTSLSLRERFSTVDLVGFDVSEAAVRRYRERVCAPCYRTDMASNEFPRVREELGQFDVAIVIGGLHHCGHHLTQVLFNISSLLKDNGLLLMMEPNQRFAGERLRRAWYAFDRYFEEEDEIALDHDALIGSAEDFTLETVKHFGGPAYFMILNSLLFRLPPSAKPVLMKGLFPIESQFNRLPFRWMFPAFIARWRRRIG